MVAQVNLSKSSVVQGLFFNEIARSHMKRRLWRGGHPCSEVTIKKKTAVRDTDQEKLRQTKCLKLVQYARGDKLDD